MKYSSKKLALTALPLCMSLGELAFAKQQPPKNVIPAETARKTATKLVPGKIQSEELEFEHGQWIYSFDMKSAGAVIHEVQVDAISGKVVSNKIESSAAEAKEQKEEKQNNENETD